MTEQTFGQFVTQQVDALAHRPDTAHKTLAEMVEIIRHENAGLLESFGPSMVLDALHRRVKAALKALSESDVDQLQMHFDGLRLPQLTCYRDEAGDYRYVSTVNATLQQVESQYDIRDANVEAVARRRDSLAESIDELRPYMADPSTTVAQAIEARRLDVGEVA